MIERKELEKLIEQEATVYKEPHISICLKNNCEISGGWLVLNINGSHEFIAKLDDLYKTREEAEWHAENDDEKTFYFEPPTWEDFHKKPFGCFDFMGNKMCRQIIELIKDETKELHIYIYTPLEDSIDFGLATKENYEKAVAYSRRLFKGDEV